MNEEWAYHMCQRDLLDALVDAAKQTSDPNQIGALSRLVYLRVVLESRLDGDVVPFLRGTRVEVVGLSPVKSVRHVSEAIILGGEGDESLRKRLWWTVKDLRYASPGHWSCELEEVRGQGNHLGSNPYPAFPAHRFAPLALSTVRSSLD